jgi:hypothetical protein
MLTRPLVGDLIEHKDAVENGIGHDWFSNWKIWSVEEEKMRAKMRASSSEGT